MAQSASDLAWAMYQGVENRRQEVPGAHGDFSGGDGHMQQALGQVRTVALENGGTQRRPYQALNVGDSGLLGVERMHIGIGFPLFEQQLHLPAQRIPVDIEARLCKRTIEIDEPAASLGSFSYRPVFSFLPTQGAKYGRLRYCGG